jgi:spermidine synthase
VDDGRNYLLLTPKRYDVITADLIQPVNAGAGNLYSAEYFRLAGNALKDDGLMLQWIGKRSATQYKMLMRTFLSVFPEATLWADGELLVGAKRPLQMDRGAVESKLRDSETRGALADVSITSFDSLAALYMSDAEAMRKFVGPGPLLTDDRPQLEYFISLPRDEAVLDLNSLRSQRARPITQP